MSLITNEVGLPVLIKYLVHSFNVYSILKCHLNVIMNVISFDSCHPKCHEMV